ncbi:MAG TPA: porin family protein, partial [Puia sp.]|nr:porin family protein [Puia sp.]
MNKKLPLLLSFVIAVSISHAQIKLGGFIGVHSANVIENNNTTGWLTDTKPYYSSKTGIQLGMMGDIPLGQTGFHFQPGIFYSAKGRQFNKNYDTSNMTGHTIYPVYQNTVLKLDYIEIPLNIAYKIFLTPTHKSNFFISAGPYVAFMYSSKMTNQSLSVQDDSNYTYNNGIDDLPIGNGPTKYKTTDIGMNARVGFEFGNVILSAYGSKGFTNFFTPQGYQGTYHHQLIGASIGIWLTKTQSTLSQKPVKPVTIKPADTDMDGVADNIDLCPTIPGLTKYNGCPVPDTDKDGINDEEDSCKTVAGVAKYHGCPVPDTDGDGINDEEDSC